MSRLVRTFYKRITLRLPTLLRRLPFALADQIVSSAVGFSDPERMRRAFLRLYGEPPQSLRRKARH
jgi:transcriptional regulator GlxA family with amidase domain